MSSATLWQTMPWNVSFLIGPAEGIPECSWSDFCRGVDIEEPEWAKKLLDGIAGRYRTSGQAGLPGAILARAEDIHKDPYVVWLWTITNDFRGELEGMRMRDDACVPDNYYLLNVMRKQCKGEVKDWTTLVDDCMHDKEMYKEVKLRVARHYGLDGLLDLEMFLD